MQQHLFTALGMLNSDPAAAVLEENDYDEDDQTLIGLSNTLSFYGGNRYALLDAWERHPEWMHGLEMHLLQICRQPAHQEQPFYDLSHAADLLREAFRRSHSLAERERLCREIGPQQGWPYEDLIGAYQQQEQWADVLAWADDGLAKLPPQSAYRPTLEAARGTALLRLERPAEALVALQSLFKRKCDQLSDEVEQQVLAEVANRTSGFTTGSLMVAALLGCAHLLEGQIERAVAWALRSNIPAGWADHDLSSTVASGLLRMGLAAARAEPDEVLRETLDSAPRSFGSKGRCWTRPR